MKFLWLLLLVSSVGYGQEMFFTKEDVQVLQSLKTTNSNWKNLPKKDSIKSYKFKNQEIEGVWSGSYWPMIQGGITSRWQRHEKPFARIPTYDEISKMSPAERNSLSPAEKYDFVMGDRAMTLTNAERNYIKSRGKLEGWFGYCHGTAPASANEKEPLNAISVPANGTSVVFYPDDMKALVTAYYAHSEGATIGLGKRCGEDFNGRPLSDLFKRQKEGCNDTNPGAFHIALTHRIKQGKSFVVEIDKGRQIWNYAVYGYELTSRLALFNPKPFKLNAYRIDLVLDYVDGTNPNKKRQFKLGKKKLDYTIYVEKRSNKIVGGRWNHEAAQGGSVDFIWFKDSPGKDTRNVIQLDLVRKMIEASRK